MTMQTQAVRPSGEPRRGGRVRSDPGSTAVRSAAGRVDRLVHGLGWFSLGLGITQILAPRALSRMIGLRGDRHDQRAMRGIGAREIVTGIGLLTRARPAGWLWARVGGDLSDLGLMGTALAVPRVKRGRAAGAMIGLVSVTVADVFAGRELGRRGGARPDQARRRHGRPVMESITIDRPREEVYRFFRDLRNLPRFMAHLESVEILDDRRSRWTARVPGGRTIAWQAEITEDRPNERIAWRSALGSQIETSGSVSFERAPGDRGTEVHVEMRHERPGGAIGKAVGKVVGGAIKVNVASDLRRFKQVMELGEVVQSDASIHRGPHPARPPDEAPRPGGGMFDGPGRVEREIAASAGGGVR